MLKLRKRKNNNKKTGLEQCILEISSKKTFGKHKTKLLLELLTDLRQEGYELRLHKARNKLVKPAAIAALSFTLGVLGFTGLYKNRYMNFFNNNTSSVEYRLSAPITKPYKRIIPFNIEQEIVMPGKIPIPMYHKFGLPEDRFTVSSERFRLHLQMLYENDFQLISIEDYINNDFSSLLPGKKAAVITFDDADKGQMEYATFNGELIYDKHNNPVIDPECAVGVMLDFYKQHPDFGKKAAFFIDWADENHDYQAPFCQDNFVRLKLLFLLNQGFEICYHTYSHPDAGKCTLNEFKKDHERARAAFEYHLGEKACLVKDIFAWPFGSISKDKEVMDYANSNFDASFGAYGGLASVVPSGTALFPKPRIEINNNLYQDILSKNNFLRKEKRSNE
ncbi:polysaccharide deacetylase family protein [Candidatus Woesearchaeota archaeon]|nr:polysaccharide deacetylase family protein [Candidatus Woesearchaeota archaeon]